MHLCLSLGYRSRRDLWSGKHTPLTSLDFTEWMGFWKHLGGWGPEREDERSVHHTAALMSAWTELKKGIAFLYPLDRIRKEVGKLERKQRLLGLVAGAKQMDQSEE